ETVHRLNGFLGPAWNERFARHFHAIVGAYDQEGRSARGAFARLSVDQAARPWQPAGRVP
ncbi:hypothetical protein ACWEP3_28225, partial [Streptomyces albidoflavus]